MHIQFVSPSFLWCLALISIPVIIHLFNFRRFKKVLFTNVKFLKELKEETNSRSRLKHLLVLLSRILAVAFLVLAFAQPFIPAKKQAVNSGEAVVSVYIDNSFGMMLQGEDGNLLELAKTKAAEVVNAFPPATQFQLLTNELSGAQQRLLSKEEMLDEIAKAKINSASRNFNDIIARQQEMFASGSVSNKQSYYISDFQKSVFPASLRSDTTINLNLISLQSNSHNNVFIDSCWLSSPFIMQNEPVELTVKFRNSGTEAVGNIPVKLVINGTQKAVATVAVAAGGEALSTINFTATQAGWQEAEVAIVDNPVTFDDRYFFSFKVADKINVYHVAGRGNPYINTLFGNNPVFSFNSTGLQSVDYSAMQRSQAVVVSDAENISSGLADELKKFIQKGGTVILFPDSVVNVASYNSFLTSTGADALSEISNNVNRVDKLDMESDVFKSVFEKREPEMNLPAVSSYYNLTTFSKSSRQVLMRLQDGSPFLCEYKSGSGKLFLFTSAAGSTQSSFVKHALFVPVITRIAFLSIPAGEIAYTIGSHVTIPLSESVEGSEAIPHLVNADKNIDVIPEIKNAPEGSSVFPGNEINAAGFYRLMNQNRIMEVIAMNYNRAESALDFYTESELGNIVNASLFKSVNILSGNMASLTASIKDQSQGISLWKYCIMLTLLFLGIEIALLRLLK